MRRLKGRPDDSADLRPKINLSGVAKLMNVSRATLYRRLENEMFSLEGIPVLVTRRGKLYDMEGVFGIVFPSADAPTVSLMMYDFMQNNRGLVK